MVNRKGLPNKINNDFRQEISDALLSRFPTMLSVLDSLTDSKNKEAYLKHYISLLKFIIPPPTDDNDDKITSIKIIRE